jgi:hypothetical protein
MAPLPTNGTPRVWVEYNDGQNDHKLMVRYAASGPSVEEVLLMIASIWGALDPNWFAVTILGARAASSGSDISFPVPWPGDPSYGTGAMPANRAPLELRFLGRDDSGRKVSWSFYGGDFVVPDTFRFPYSVGGSVADVIDSIAAATASFAFFTINLQAPQIYQFADVNYNSYWERQSRG